eukprot:8115934-Pyramimonas_sp.AAC.1
MAQYSLRHASKRPQDGRKTVSSSLRTLPGRPQDANILQKPTGHQYCLSSRCFASDGFLRPQDGPKTAQDSPTRGPTGPHGGRKSAQDRFKSGPRGPQNSNAEPPKGRWELEASFFFSDRAQDGPKRPLRHPRRAPQRAPDPPKELQEGLKTPPKSPKKAL